MESSSRRHYCFKLGILDWTRLARDAVCTSYPHHPYDIQWLLQIQPNILTACYWRITFVITLSRLGFNCPHTRPSDKHWFSKNPAPQQSASRPCSHCGISANITSTDNRVDRPHTGAITSCFWPCTYFGRAQKQSYETRGCVPRMYNKQRKGFAEVCWRVSSKCSCEGIPSFRNVYTVRAIPNRDRMVLTIQQDMILLHLQRQLWRVHCRQQS